jgi:hypothetical protein
MMWAGRSALPPIAPHAVVSRPAVEQSERSFAEAHDLELRIDQSFVEFERAQPSLAAFLAGEFSALRGGCDGKEQGQGPEERKEAQEGQGQEVGVQPCATARASEGRAARFALGRKVRRTT